MANRSIPQNILNKADPFLKERLLSANENENLTIIVSLLEDAKNDDRLNRIKPIHFSSRLEYRQALIDARKQQLNEGITKETFNELKNNSIFVSDLTTSSVLVVEGNVAQIIRCLGIGGVKSASLDRTIVKSRKTGIS